VSPPTESDAPVIATDGLTKRFGSFTALDGLSIEVSAGEVFGFLGPNGAGKTTTVRMLLGLAKPAAGTATVFGFDCWAQRQEAHRDLAFVPGEFNAWPTLRGGEMLDLLGAVHGPYDVAFRHELCQRLVFDPTKRGRDYSKGNRQKISLIAAFMSRPKLLILDEPTSGLDPLMEVEFRRLVEEAKANGQTVFLSSHILSEVEVLCDRVGILREGKLVEVGTLDEMRKLKTKEVVVEFAAAPLPDLKDVAGVEDISVEGLQVTLRLRGEPTELVRALAPHEVRSLDVREPSLEELFLTFYGSTPPPSP
jgi:ABC-2 type transport system ATP-binding protein